MEELKEVVNNDSSEELLVDADSSAIKDYFVKETGLSINEMSELFGQSEEEVLKEFGYYKAKKLYSKLDYIIDEPQITVDEFKSRCLIAEKYGFKSVTVLPTFVGLAKNILKGKNVLVRALISYPFGEDLDKVKYYSVKKTVQMGADAFLIMVSVNKIKRGLYKLVAKDVKKIVKYSGKKQVTVMLDLDYLTPLEIESSAKAIVKDSKVYSIMPSSLFLNNSIDVQIIKDIFTAVNGKCYVESGGKIKSATETVSLLTAGAFGVSSKSCPTIAEELNNKILQGVN